jgi:hypothetical protein
MLLASCIQDVGINMDGLLDGILAVKPNDKLLQECQKAKQIKGLAVSTLANLIKQILDPDINAAVCETTELIKQTKLGLIGKCGVNGVSLTANPHLLDCSDRIDTALANILECATTAEHRGIEVRF